ncbi:MAG: hypothetical protein PHY92_01600 [Alphaproteobacteria bacterium]|nr:hypothetical protein [Alphaproteobacteria bacterium]
MRIRPALVLLVLIGFSLPALATAAVVTPCNPHDDICLGQSCETIGLTTMDKDQKSLLACLIDKTGNLRWKTMAPVYALPNGNVGIGTTQPTDMLQITGGNLRLGELNPYNTGAFPNYGRFLMFSGGPSGPGWDSDNSDYLWMARYNANYDITELRMNIGDNPGAHSDKFVVGSYNCCTDGLWYPVFTVSMLGRVGINVSEPQTALDVNGSIKVGNDSTVCAAATAGTIHFNSTTNTFEGCDGATWKPVNAPKITRAQNSCETGWCEATCPDGYLASGGGYLSYWGENIDYNGPSDSFGFNKGWGVADSSWLPGFGPLTVYAVCMLAM